MLGTASKNEVFLHSPIGSFRWMEDWVTMPCTEPDHGRRTHGLAVGSDDRIYIFYQSNPALLVFDESGRLLDAWGDYGGAHGLFLEQGKNTDYLWLIDHKSGAVRKSTSTGEVILEIEQPLHSAYMSGQMFSPTLAVVNESTKGGNGDIWVADGYGASLVHRYGPDGLYLLSIDGGDVPFSCPHGLAFIANADCRELWVADRRNRLIQVFDEEGRFLRHFGDDFLTSPNGFVQLGYRVLVPELYGRLTFVDLAGKLLGYMGENPAIASDPGWPDSPAGGLIRGKFNSPHYAAADRLRHLPTPEHLEEGRSDLWRFTGDTYRRNI